MSRLPLALGLLQSDWTARVKRGRSHRPADADSQRPLDLTGTPLRGMASSGGLSDARVIREGPTIADVYIGKGSFL